MQTPRRRRWTGSNLTPRRRARTSKRRCLSPRNARRTPRRRLRRSAPTPAATPRRPSSERRRKSPRLRSSSKPPKPSVIGSSARPRLPRLNATRSSSGSVWNMTWSPERFWTHAARTSTTTTSRPNHSRPYGLKSRLLNPKFAGRKMRHPSLPSAPPKRSSRPVYSSRSARTPPRSAV